MYRWLNIKISNKNLGIYYVPGKVLEFFISFS